MDPRRLYRTIEGFAEKKYGSSQELLVHVLQQIVANDRLDIQGGRLWKLDQVKYAYALVTQVGDVEKIRPNFSINIDEYKMFKLLPVHKTIVAKETNSYLRSRGIARYSATGVGDLVKVRGTDLFPYVLSFNTKIGREELAPTLNIIGIAVTALLRNRSIEKKSALLQKDLDKAREIQDSILPEHELFFHHYEMFGVSVADRIVGGDFFDYIVNEEDGRVSVVIGDAASKGISAAVQALYVSGALRMGAGYETKVSSLIRRINTLVNRTFSDERFLTLFFAELSDDRKGLCVYTNAGHNSPILLRAATNSVEFLEPTGQIIGPFPNQKYRSEGVIIGKGDVLLLYTDGVSEAMDAAGAMFTEHRIVDKLKEYRMRSAREIAQMILDDVQRFSARSKYADDKTIVVIKRKK